MSCTLGSHLCAAFEEKALESGAGPHQGLDAVLGDLITPGDVELLQQRTALTEQVDRKDKDKGLCHPNIYKIKAPCGVSRSV